MKQILSIILLVWCVNSFGQYSNPTGGKVSKFDLERAFHDALKEVEIPQLQGKGEIINGQKEGVWEFYSASDPAKVVCKGAYKNGLKTGVWENHESMFDFVVPADSSAEKFMSSLPRSVEEWRDGQLIYWGRTDGMEIMSDSGISQDIYNKITRIDKVYSHFILMYSHVYFSARSDLDDIAQAKINNLLKDNKANAKLTYHNSVSDSTEEITYHEGNETLAISKRFNGEILTGITKSKMGIVVENYTYIEGNQANCDIKKFFENGNKKEVSKIRNGVPDGKWAGFHENGKRKYTGTYRQGKKHGKWKMYDTEGNLVDEVKYKDGVKI